MSSEPERMTDSLPVSAKAKLIAGFLAIAGGFVHFHGRVSKLENSSPPPKAAKCPCADGSCKCCVPPIVTPRAPA